MTLSSQLYCNNCGAANQDQTELCFVCEAPLHTPSKELLLKERYRILVPVGQGGFGNVYKVEDTEGGNRLLAMKEINLSALTVQESIEATAAFNREVALLSGLTYSNLPRIYDHFTDSEHWYLVTDFIEGETLEQYLKRTRSGRLPLEEVLDIGIQLCTVLDYLHSREPPIIFRDLKPANVMRTSIRIWDVVTGKTLFTYRGHSDWVNAVAWSPCGTRIASGGRDKAVHMWDAVTGLVMFTYHGHSSWVYAVAWSPDGTRIASAGNDGTVQIWQAV